MHHHNVTKHYLFVEDTSCDLNRSMPESSDLKKLYVLCHDAEVRMDTSAESSFKRFNEV